MYDSATVPAAESNGDHDADDSIAVLDHDMLDGLRDLPGEGAENLLEELIVLFTKEAPSRMTQLRAAVQQGDAKSVMQMAHSLKGSSANLGASCMAGICNRLEQCGREGMLDGALQLHDELERECKRVLLALNRELTHPA